MSDAKLQQKLLDDSLEALRDELRGEWDALAEATRELAEEVVADKVEILVLAASGHDVTQEEAHLKAQVANLKATATVRVASAVDKAVEVGAKILGGILGETTRRLVGGL